jgi:Spy/CpxP family protein refolding chaperone
MRSLSLVLSFILGLALGPAASAAGGDPGHAGHAGHAGYKEDQPSLTSPYAGQEARRIKSLSEQDIDELRNGRGWGLAKAAELNGMPGPLHLLEMRDAIGLTPGQTAAIEALFRRMKAQAVTLGERLIALERDLNDAFARGDIGEAALAAKLDTIGRVQTQLRMTHLETHLATPKILKPEQVAAYNRLRGYAASDPCANPPQGHDAALWRRHNGC